MGNQNSNGEQKGKKIIESKLNVAAKTGVLNIADQSLHIKSSVWQKLTSLELCNKLKSLDISKNDIKKIPIEIVSLCKLKTLMIYSCKLTSLPDLSPLNQLCDLQASNNLLENGGLDLLPVSIIKCDLSHNRFNTFPIELVVLSNLKELNLSHNRITSLEGIGHLVSLTHLYLDHNQLREVPVEVRHLKVLKLISLKYNVIEKDAVSSAGQSIPAELFLETIVDHINLEGNTGLTKADVLKFEGIDAFLERRQKGKDKTLYGGALTDFSLFGID